LATGAHLPAKIYDGFLLMWCNFKFEGVAGFFFVFSSSSDELSESLLLSTFLLVFVFRADGGGTLLYDGTTFV
jgi:hypothetical protein